MTLNRDIMREKGLSERIITRIMVKAVKFGVMYDKMAYQKRGWLVPTPHFKKNEWIKCQLEQLKTLRYDYLASNKQVLKIVRGLK